MHACPIDRNASGLIVTTLLSIQAGDPGTDHHPLAHAVRGSSEGHSIVASERVLWLRDRKGFDHSFTLDAAPGMIAAHAISVVLDGNEPLPVTNDATGRALPARADRLLVLFDGVDPWRAGRVLAGYELEPQPAPDASGLALRASQKGPLASLRKVRCHITPGRE